ncbi:MAG: DUF2249 domain-containing protein [Betaproteobacteria bacterium]|nr:DUF2249 domain-containing protein [Betaproteobacteria bacterium]
MTAEPANTTIELDVRDLEPPEPMQQALAALAVLKPGQQLRMLLHREPFPLYAMLRERGFTYRTTPLADGNYEIMIRP